MTDGDLVIVQDRSQGTIHKRVRMGKSLASLEGCNADAAGSVRILFDLVEADTPSRKCRRCFPPDDVPDDVAVAPV